MGIIICITIAVACIIWWAYRSGRPSKFAEFIRDNPKRASISIVVNDSILADLHSDRLMVLASTVKIIIAIEYAQQVALGKIDPNEMISLSEAEKYYIKNTDGGAHPKWLKELKRKKLVKDGMVRLEEIAKGMIRFSSNANTEYLMERLGLDNINSNLAKLGLEQHQPLYPFVSALFIYKEVGEDQLEQIPMGAYRDFANAIHNELRDNNIAYKNSIERIPLNIQRIWNDRLPASTTKEYVSILEKINSRSYFEPVVQKSIEILMECMMDKPENKSRFTHVGMKGGSTASVLTVALYATTKEGDKIEMAYFLNGLTLSENLLWQSVLKNFHKAILKDKKTRDELVSIINSVQPG